MLPGLKERLLGLINDPAYTPLKKEELALIFDIHPTEMPMFYNFLDELEEDGYIGKTKKGEIDFIASKNNKFKYIQVCFDLSDESTRIREFNAFDDIDDNNKFIITLTKKDYSTNDVKQINIFDFLMNDEF